MLIHSRRPKLKQRLYLEALESRVLLSVTDLGDVGQYTAHMVQLGPALYFTAGDGQHGDELWKTDGTVAGTVLVKEINPLPGNNVTLSALTMLGNKLLFSADDGQNGKQIWVSDGTEAGTHVLAGTMTDPGGFLFSLPVFNGEAYFILQGQNTSFLWKTDGTAGGTEQVLTLPVEAGDFATYYDPFLVGNLLYMHSADFASGVKVGEGLYTLNLTNGQLNAALSPTVGITFTKFTNVDGVVYYYTGSLLQTGLHLERYDPAHGRIQIATTTTDPVHSLNLPAIASSGGKVYFTADDANLASRLMVTDGTAAGTRAISRQAAGTRPINFTVAAGKLYYFAQIGPMFSLFTSDGTEAGTKALANGPPNSDVWSTATGYNGKLVYVSIGNDGNPNLWASDGTVAGTKLIQSLAGLVPPNPTHTWTYDLREIGLLGSTLVIRSRPDGVRYHLNAVNLGALLGTAPVGGLDSATASSINGHARDPSNPNGDVTIRVTIDGATNTTFTATQVDPVNGRRFTWYVPALRAGTRTVDFFVIDSFSGAATKIGTTKVTGNGSLFDERWYLKEYPDVAAEVRAGTYASGFAQFQAVGNRQGRSPSPFFNPQFYLQQNPDVAKAISQGRIASAWDHFRMAGQFEKRDPSPFFNTAYYLSQYPDVAAAVMAAKFSAFQHFVFTGQFERRDITPYFSQKSYFDSNPDIQSTVATGFLASPMVHFLLAGQKEHRPYTAPSAFSETAYLARYADVKAAVMAGKFDSGLEHFLWAGLKEGRLPT